MPMHEKQIKGSQTNVNIVNLSYKTTQGTKK